MVLPLMSTFWLQLLLAGFCLASCRASCRAADSGPVATDGIVSVSLSQDALQLVVRLQSSSDELLQIGELQPWQADQGPVETLDVKTRSTDKEQIILLPRWAGGRDRIDSRFVAIAGNTVVGTPRYVTGLTQISRDTEPFPQADSRKGLQVQMLDDAIALKIRHATLNVNLAGMVDVHHNSGSLVWESNGQQFHFHPSVVRSFDRQIRTLTDANVHVYLILLNYIHGDPAVDAVMRHPDSPKKPRNGISAFNIVTQEGTAWYRAAIDFLAHRYSGPDHRHGRVVGYIVGNEVNSHSYWHAQGSAEPNVVIEQYHRMLRVAHTAVRRASASARIYVSLDHFWTGRIGNDPLEAFGGKLLLDELAKMSKEGGDFDWHVAHHPYPENLFEPRSWLDRSPLNSAESPRITFKNLNQLTEYLQRDEMLSAGQPRRVILSEQGFHSPAAGDGQKQQAAGFCYAWIKVRNLDGIDAFILHRHVDHAHEGGLNLGLWTRQNDSIASPFEKKQLYDVFRLADTDEWEQAFEFALSEIGIAAWTDL